MLRFKKLYKKFYNTYRYTNDYYVVEIELACLNF